MKNKELYLFAGNSALSSFQKEQLLLKCKQISENIESISSQFIHLVNMKGLLSQANVEMLNKLFSSPAAIVQDNIIAFCENPLAINSSLTDFLNTTEKYTFYKFPRIGTTSPWSSKATDIANNIGIENLDKIERGTVFQIGLKGEISKKQKEKIQQLLSDKMVDSVFDDFKLVNNLFQTALPKTFKIINIIDNGIAELEKANESLGLALSFQEIEYLFDTYNEQKKNPTDVELYMFSQANSEHCRHKIFNAKWSIDGEEQQNSLFAMIKNTTKVSPTGVLSAYKDNASVISGNKAGRFFANAKTQKYEFNNEQIDILMKVETHNHPTAISPYSGAATGIGGEIRDEGATGLGSKPKAGLCGFTTSNLNIPNFSQKWEVQTRQNEYGKPSHIVSALDIMLKAPVGGANYSNEFGRPNINGYFRTFEQSISSVSPLNGDKCTNEVFGYHKPIMVAGGFGNIKQNHIKKTSIPVGSKLICLGGPAFKIGLGGGSASSFISTGKNLDLDFASVQRDNAEMERRCQEVIDSCWAMNEQNPINFIHDVGAGGISNAFPELVKDGGVGGEFSLRNINIAESGMTPLEIWSNESQERYVISVTKENLNTFEKIAMRERCPYAIVGTAIKNNHLSLQDDLFEKNKKPVDIDMSLLFGNTPLLEKNITRVKKQFKDFDISEINIRDAIERVLSLPTVASKSFLITIGDRSITGMVAREQMVGAYQIPVADCGVTTASLDSLKGEAVAMGEKTPIAIINSKASGRMSIGEAITNILSADIKQLSDIKMSANWMVASGYDGEDEKLFDTVKSIGMDFCPKLGISIPVGKDSMSMQTKWLDGDIKKSVVSPLSLIVTAFSPVENAMQTITPVLKNIKSSLLLLDLGRGENRLGGSCLAQVYSEIGNISPDIEPETIKDFFSCLKTLKSEELIQAYHDRSDGGLFTTLVEMSFAGNVGLNININSENIIADLFNEELGVVIQVDNESINEAIEICKNSNVVVSVVAELNDNLDIEITNKNISIYKDEKINLQKIWSKTSYEIQKIRDNPSCAKQEYSNIETPEKSKLFSKLTFDLNEQIYASSFNSYRPKIAILREQGVNGHIEMAAVFNKAGFDSYDVHMSDIISKVVTLKDFDAIVACGGFSYGDVLGAGGGWAKNILLNPYLKQQFSDFFARENTLSLGVCNGCQMLSQLKTIIKGAENFPNFVKNISNQFEARTVMVEIQKTNSIWTAGMQGSMLPVPIAHGEGRVLFENKIQEEIFLKSNQITMNYVDGFGKVTENYPLNPNGSTQGITALTALDGRMQIMMPHPERAFRTVSNSWISESWKDENNKISEYAPWFRMFSNARKFFN